MASIIWLLLLLLLLLLPAAECSQSSRGDIASGAVVYKLLVPPTSSHNAAFVSYACPAGELILNCTVSGLAAEVFEECAQTLSLQYEFLPFHPHGDAWSYNDMLYKLVNDQDINGVIADVTISSTRLEKVDFTQPYMPSTLEMITSSELAKSSKLWNFLQPFSGKLWACIVLLFFSTGILIFLLEHNNPKFHKQGVSLRTRFADVIWFTGLTLFFSHRAEVNTKLGRVLTLGWLIMVLVITSSYTASLASMLTTNQLTPRFQSFSDLLTRNLSIGYRNGSYLKAFLQNLYDVDSSKLIPLDDIKEYDHILQQGRVAAILDESPYVDAFLNANCGSYSKASDINMLGGFGFAFKKNYSLTDQISKCILTLKENGELQQLQNRWIGVGNCSQIDSTNQMSLENFHGILLIITSLYSACIFFKILSWVMERLKEWRYSGSLIKVNVDPTNLHEKHVVDIMVEYDLQNEHP